MNSPDAEATSMSGWVNINKPSFSNQKTVSYTITLSVPNNALVYWTVTKRTLYYTSMKTIRSPPQTWCNGFTVVGAQAPNNSDILYISMPINSAGYVMGLALTYGGSPSTAEPTVKSLPVGVQGLFFVQYYSYLDQNNAQQFVLANALEGNCDIGTYYGNITVNLDEFYKSTNWDYVMMSAGSTNYNLS